MNTSNRSIPGALQLHDCESAPGEIAPWIIRWGFYPLALIATLSYIFAEVHGLFGSVGKAYPFYLGTLIAVMITLERLYPLRREWGMTHQKFFIRDLPMLAVNGAAIGLTSKLITWLSLHAGAQPLFTLSISWWLQAIVLLAVFDFMWYWFHRISHKGAGIVGKWLWKIHVLHHLPSGVYVFMHPAGHPLNGVVVRTLMMMPAILLGVSPEAVFAAGVVNGFQGIISHFNVDSRAGWFNNIFMGTELHRFHHSADVDETKNYAATFSFWDRLFGTYRLSRSTPSKLGVENRDEYPEDKQWIKLMALPFH